MCIVYTYRYENFILIIIYIYYKYIINILIQGILIPYKPSKFTTQKQKLKIEN